MYNQEKMTYPVNHKDLENEVECFSMNEKAAK